MDVQIYEFEPGRWSYKVGGTPSGETFPSRAAALIAAEQVKDKQEQAPASPEESEGQADPLI